MSARRLSGRLLLCLLSSRSALHRASPPLLLCRQCAASSEVHRWLWSAFSGLRKILRLQVGRTLPPD